MTQQTDRAVAFDLLRSAALLRIFLWHATGWAVLTWIGAVPVMFFVAGVFAAKSIDTGGYFRTLCNRLRRILLPYWVFAVAIAATVYSSGSSYEPGIKLVGWVVPVVEPDMPAWESGWVVGPLWYLRTYFWLFVLSGIIYSAVKRSLLGTLLTLGGAVLLGEMLLGTGAWELQSVVFGSFFLALGMGWGQVAAQASSMGRTLLGSIGALVAAVGAAVAMPQGFVVNDSHVLSLGIGLLWVVLATAVVERIGTVGRALGKVVKFANDRSMTIYLYHAPLTGLAYVYLARAWGVQGWAGVLGSVLVGGALTFVVSSIVGMVEDFAARRWTGHRATTGVLLGGAMAALAVLGPNGSHVRTVSNLPPAPSRAPEKATFEVANDMAFLLPGGAGHAAAWAESEKPRDPEKGTNTANPGNNSGAAHDRQDTEPGSDPSATVAAVVVNGRVPEWEDLAPDAGEDRRDEIATILQTWLEGEKERGRMHPGGVDVAVLQPGKLRMAVGVATDGSVVVPVGRFEYASITKSFTAALLLRAVEQGRVKMDEPIGSLAAAPWFTLSEELTLRDVLTHRSGLVNYTDTAAWRRDWTSVDGWESALRAVQAEGLAFEPGSRIAYSSSNYILAGVVVSQLYGRGVEDVITNDLLEPLGLADTRVGPGRAGAPGNGTGNMRGTIEDLSRWAVAMWRDRSVLGEAGNAYADWADPENLIGFGSFSYCPCRATGSRVAPAGIGANGAGTTVRYYRSTDTVVAVRVPEGMTPEVEELIASVLRAVQ